MISVENATFTYPGATSPILRNVSFEVPERSLLAILGPNGAGKTTLLRTMIGLQKIQAFYPEVVSLRNFEEYVPDSANDLL